MEQETVKKILTELEKLYPDPKPALKYRTPYELLIAVILSAQCTDVRVNQVTDVLFQNYSTPEKMITLTQSELEKYIFSCGFYRMKAEHILSASKDILEKFSGQVPETIEELQTLAGVGRKTALVVYAFAFGKDAIPVDTHVFRVGNRLGIGKGNTPLKVEQALCKVIPKDTWSKAHHYLIWHGRKVCHSQRPDCKNCTLREFCEHQKDEKNKPKK